MGNTSARVHRDRARLPRSDGSRRSGVAAIALRQMAWGVILLASGDAEAAARVVDNNGRYESRLRVWLAGHSLVEHAIRLRSRAEVEEFDSQTSELDRILDRPDVLATGISVRDAVGLIGGEPAVEVYSPAGHRQALIGEHALESAPGSVRIRWVRDDIWPLLDQDHDGRAPRIAVLVDLLENDDPRARREAARALAR